MRAGARKLPRESLPGTVGLCRRAAPGPGEATSVLRGESGDGWWRGWRRLRSFGRGSWYPSAESAGGRSGLRGVGVGSIAGE